jgi:toluene monooxygenase system protein A
MDQEMDMLKRTDWQDLARKLDWNFSYVDERDVFPEDISGPYLPQSAWADWQEPYKTTYREYVDTQSKKDLAVRAVKDALGRVSDFEKLDPLWVQQVKYHNAVTNLLEYMASQIHGRLGRFGRCSAWRNTSAFGCLDEIRHTEIPIQIAHELIRNDPGFDWTNKLLHTDNWVSMSARHFFDDMAGYANALEGCISQAFVFETGFTNLQFVALGAMAQGANDALFEKANNSIQTDEARHAQIGGPTLKVLREHDPEFAQRVLDKALWRDWRGIGVLTGVAMDYLTPVEARPYSFKEFMKEWVVEQYMDSVQALGYELPWYWDILLEEIEMGNHHGWGIGIYTFRPTMWMDWPVQSEKTRAWLREKYPDSFEQYYEPLWLGYEELWAKGEGAKTGGEAMVSICNLCQLPCTAIRPGKITLEALDYQGRTYVFCSKPCRWIFEQQPELYASHTNAADRLFTGEFPTDLGELVMGPFGITPDVLGMDIYNERPAARAEAAAAAAAGV